MKKHLIFIVLTLLAGIRSSGQVVIEDSEKGLFKYRNSFHLELGGHGAIGSINYERNLINTRYYKLAPQAGFSLYPSNGKWYIWTPLSINHLFSFRQQHHIETGMGAVLSSERVNDHYPHVYYTAKVGYRYQKPDGVMTYKILFTPLWERINAETNFIPWAAVAVGYNFGR